MPRAEPGVVSQPTENIERLEEIGRGGMGVVYKVKDHKFGRLAALKELTGEVSQAVIQRFQREARVTARLDHPSIPAVFDMGLDKQGQPFMLMRLIEGQTLSWHLKAKGKAGESVRAHLEALLKVAEAVAYAHEQRIIHRDLKPANIMIGRFGEVLVMDWGLARPINEPLTEDETLEFKALSELAAKAKDSAAAQDSELTLAGAVIGTPAYMAPEQADGEVADERADVFALGAILTEILTGRPPVEGDSAIVKIRNVLDGFIVKPRQRDASIARELDWIAAEALRLEKAKRTAKASAFVEQLRAYLAGQSVPGYPYTLRERFELWLREHPYALPAVSALMVIATVSALFGSAQLELNRRKRVGAAFVKARALLRRGAKAQDVKAQVQVALPDIQSLDEVLQSARIFESAGLFVDAKATLKRAVRDFPPAIPALYALHFLEIKGSDQVVSQFSMTEPLKQLLEEARRSQERNEYTLFAEAQSLIKEKKYESALAKLVEIEDFTSQLDGVYEQIGLCQVRLKRYEDAVTSFTKAISLSPEVSSYSLNRGVAYWALKQDAKAQRDLKRALALDPECALAYHFRGLSRTRQGDLSGAVADQSQALAREPENARYLLAKAVALFENSQFVEALPVLNQCLDAAAVYFTTHQDRFHSLYGWGDEGSYKMTVYCMKAKCLFSEDRHKDCVAALEAAEAIANTPMVSYTKARYALKQNLIDQVIAHCSEAINKDPSYGPALLLRGEMTMRSQDFESSLADFQRAIKAEPQNPQAHFYFGFAAMQCNQLSKALKAFDKAIEIAPHIVLNNYYRAMARARSKDYRGAIEDLKYFVRQHPNHPNVVDARTRIDQFQRLIR